MALILPTYDTCVNYGRGYCSSARAEQKPLSDFKNSSPFGRNHSRKQTGKTGKKTVLIFWEGGFGGVKWYIGPPWSGKWYWEGGSEFTIR
jgi:hypothetical protein